MLPPKPFVAGLERFQLRPVLVRAEVAERQKLLRRRGYPTEDATRCVVRLMHRVCEGPEFPHEIGLFLGYPTEDVRGFIERDTPCKCVGCWKVYGDAAAAEERFRQYRRCTAAYCRALDLGQSVERLTVADRIEKT